MQYVSLHHHSTFSFGDGYGLPREHVERAAFLGMKAMALTEHGNVSSHVQLEKACHEFGIKPIFGIEGYIAPPSQSRKTHQTILAMDQNGYANLNRLVSQSWRDFYRWPTIHLEWLEEYHEGLVILSGCADSALACTLLGGKYFGDKRDEVTADSYENAMRYVRWYQKVFGDRYYIECQIFPGLGRTCALAVAYERLSADTGVGLVATSDCHYCFANENTMQKILHASHRSSTVSQTEASWEYDITLDIPDSDERVYRSLVGTGLSENAALEALANTALIADRCNVTLPKVMPIKYPIDDERDWDPWI